MTQKKCFFYGRTKVRVPSIPPLDLIGSYIFVFFVHSFLCLSRSGCFPLSPPPLSGSITKNIYFCVCLFPWSCGFQNPAQSFILTTVLPLYRTSFKSYLFPIFFSIKLLKMRFTRPGPEGQKGGFSYNLYSENLESWKVKYFR